MVKKYLMYKEFNKWWYVSKYHDYFELSYFFKLFLTVIYFFLSSALTKIDLLSYLMIKE